jgi:hypothetical protein
MQKQECFLKGIPFAFHHLKAVFSRFAACFLGLARRKAFP